jgi:hypothetical protein
VIEDYNKGITNPNGVFSGVTRHNIYDRFHPSSLAKHPFLSHSFLEDSDVLNPVFCSLDFATVINFTEQGRQPCVQPST